MPRACQLWYLDPAVWRVSGVVVPDLMGFWSHGSHAPEEPCSWEGGRKEGGARLGGAPSFLAEVGMELGSEAGEAGCCRLRESL